jgi:hypothetical protein
VREAAKEIAEEARTALESNDVLGHMRNTAQDAINAMRAATDSPDSLVHDMEALLPGFDKLLSETSGALQEAVASRA